MPHHVLMAALLLTHFFEVSNNTPANGYVAEDGITAYVAEDGLTFYVQES